MLTLIAGIIIALAFIILGANMFIAGLRMLIDIFK